MTISDLLRQAPDAKTLESARRLFFSRRWQLLAGDGKWLWGEFKVNGPKPLRATVDLIHGHFFCSCRSRQRPCAHALSLVMILNNQSERITVGIEPPDWVLAYQNKLAERAAIAQQEDITAPVAANRLGKRATLMNSGMADLELRLIDIIDRGLADTNSLGTDFWLDMAARLTDAKLGGLGNRLRTLASKEPSPQAQIRIIGDLYLSVRAWQQRELLTEKKTEELYQLCGVNIKKDELLTLPARQDHWLVMGIVEGVEDRLRYRRVWLRGEKIKRYALLLDYAFGEQSFERSWPLTSSWQGAVHYYPGSYPQRAVFPFPAPGGRPYDGLQGYADFNSMRYDYERALSLHPWLMQYPVYLSQVRPIRQDGQFFLLDDKQQALPLPEAYDNFYTLLASSCGNPIAIFAEFDGVNLRPISLFAQAGFIKV